MTESQAAAAKTGVETSEHAALKNNSIMGAIAMVAGLITANFAPMIEQMSGGDPESNWVRIGGFVLAIAGVLQQVLAALGYTNSRSLIKRELIRANGKNGAA